MRIVVEASGVPGVPQLTELRTVEGRREDGKIIEGLPIADAGFDASGSKTGS